MNQEQKNTLLDEARGHLAAIREEIVAAVEKREVKEKVMSRDALSMSAGDAITQRRLVAHQQERVEHLKQLYPSPYFTRCDLELKGENKTMYFGKFSFSEEGIYSWITPVATLRFENPGPATYTRPDGTIQNVHIGRKGNYLIADGKLLFYSLEELGLGRELIYQEHFTRHKQGFILPEVVELMEKAQDTVIRATYSGPFIISGPAGSGKTTLALHRVAYLMQSPETMDFFPPESILVLVQDSGTKDYFSKLLPDLGIKGVAIVTFAEWAGAILKLTDQKFTNDYPPFEKQRMSYEYAKLQAARMPNALPMGKNSYANLQKRYAGVFTSEHQQIFEWQKKERLLDRFDLTLLLQAEQKRTGNLTMDKEYYEERANGTYRKRSGLWSVQYGLMIIDEFQNYLPEQLQLLSTCINPRTQSMVYVGDIAQQTQLGTIRTWESAGIAATAERVVKLQKVYRNTKEILTYIKNLGYAVEIPEQIKNGQSVQEITLPGSEEEIAYISKRLLTTTEGLMIGVLARDKEYLIDFKKHWADATRVRCLTYYEAQGVEFDWVFIVGAGKEKSAEQPTMSDELKRELAMIEKDLLYVALTRAMSELYVLGKQPLLLPKT